MKKIMFLALMVIVALSANAQKNEKGRFHVMPYVAAGYGGAMGDGVDGVKNGFTVRLGAEAEYLVADNIGISLGAEFQRRASNDTKEPFKNLDGTTEDNKVWQGYSLVNFPLLFQYHLGGWGFKAGVQPGIIVNAQTVRQKSYGGGTTDFKDQCNTFQVAIPVGVSYTFRTPITIDFRFAMPVTGIAKNTGGSGNFRTPVSLTLGVGYRF